MIGRELRHTFRNPSGVVVTLLVPTLILLLFVGVFGDTLAAGFGGVPDGRSYIDYLVPGIVLMAVGYGSSTTALFEAWTSDDAVNDAVIVTARAECLDESWLGRPLRRAMLADLLERGVDPCGERGEYHTVVTRSPLFSRPIAFELGDRVQRSGCWAIDIRIADCDLRIAG